jgi:hypothetical protein
MWACHHGFKGVPVGGGGEEKRGGLEGGLSCGESDICFAAFLAWAANMVQVR